MNKNEWSLIKCKKCLKDCKRYHAGRYPNNKDIRYVDENGREFSGHTCPECHAARAKKNAALRKELNHYATISRE